MTPRQIAAFLPRVAEVVRRIQAGLDAQGAQIALVGTGTGVPSEVMGWVDPTLGERISRATNPDLQKSEALPTTDAGRSGPIHLTKAARSPGTSSTRPPTGSPARWTTSTARATRS